MESPEDALGVEPFEKLLRHYLGATAHTDVLIIHDESVAAYLSVLYKACMQSQVWPTFLHFPIEQQRYLSGRKWESDQKMLPGPAKEAIRYARYIVTLVAPNQDLVPFRRALLTAERAPDCRLLHIPGLTDAVMRAAHEAPVDWILNQARQLALALGFEDKIVVKSYTAQSEELVFEAKLSGWSNEPMMSPGILFPGGWGNLPPGEVFCCPALEDMKGEVCINGSIPDVLLDPEDETRILIADGRIVEWSGKESSPCVKFLQEQKQRATERNDEYWDAVAEIGIGLNAAVSSLTGSSLFDEKALGTAHIALGDNSCFGHPVQSAIHADLVIRKPTISIGNIEILRAGKFNSNLESDLKKYVSIPRYKFVDHMRVTLNHHAVVTSDSSSTTFCRRLHRGTRVGIIPLIEGNLGRFLNSICQHLALGLRIPITSLTNIFSDEQYSLDLALSILYHLRIIAAEPAPEFSNEARFSPWTSN